jgi:hypothetical protein
MKKSILLCLSLLLVGTAIAQSPAKIADTNASPQFFWGKFKAAVIRGDKTTVVNLSQFPITMPFGMHSIKTRSQLLQGFGKIFSSETDAAKCFSKANPEVDQAKPNEFTITCKNAAGDDVIVYSFALTRNGWRFRAFDNINE